MSHAELVDPNGFSHERLGSTDVSHRLPTVEYSYSTSTHPPKKRLSGIWDSSFFSHKKNQIFMLYA